MQLQLPNECREQISMHAERTFPEECCGTMLGRDREDGVREVVQILEIDNVKDENRARRFLIDPKDLLKAEQEARADGLDVIGIYHSHPNHPSRPSEFDREHAMPFWSYLIASCMEGKTASIQSFRLRDDRGRFDEEKII